MALKGLIMSVHCRVSTSPDIKLWKTGGGGGRLCCFCSAIQTRLGPSLLLEERSETPIVFVSFVLSATPQVGETAKVYK